MIVKLNNNDISFKKNLPLALSIVLSGLAVLVSQTRGVWGGCALSLILMTFLVHRKWSLVVTSSLSIVSGLLYYFWFPFKDRILFFFNASHNYDSERIALWKANWMIFKDHPFLGIGYGEYKTMIQSYFVQLGLPPNQFASHAHNQYLHFLSGTGILGLTCFLFFVSFVYKKTLYGIKKAQTQTQMQNQLHQFQEVFVGSLGAQTCFLLGGLTESNFERAKVKLVYLFLSSLSIAYLTKMTALSKMTSNQLK